jgi:hypothetical protein
MAKLTYADSIQPSFGIPFPADRLMVDQGELKCKLTPEQQLQLSTQEIEDLVTLLEEQPAAEKINPLDWMFITPSWQKVLDLWKTAKCQVLFGGNRCITGDTPILCAKTGVERPVSSIKGLHEVLSHNYRTGESIPLQASEPFRKGKKDCLYIELEDGNSFICSKDHRILTLSTQTWVHAKHLKTKECVPSLGRGLYTRVKSITNAGLHECWDMSVPVGRNYYAAGCFHHNSMKTSLASGLNLDIMRKIPEAMTYSLQDNEERSNLINQAYLYNNLPLELKNTQKKRGKATNLTYTQLKGFTNDACILPPQDGYEKGSACHFKNYAQFFNNPQSFEGIKGHLIHADEEIPFPLFESLFGRLGDYHGRLILTVTTLQGYTPLVDDLMKGAETLEERYAPMIGRALPTLQKCKSWPDTYIHYLWTEDNPFIDGQEIVRSYANRPLDVRKARLYGIPTKSAGAQFPKFSREANVIPHHEIPFIKDPKSPVTVYQGVDPGDGKPWFMHWLGFTPDGNAYLFCEFPDFGSFGEWAIPHQNATGQPIGKKGPAQKPLGYGFNQWKDTILEIEKHHGFTPVIRWMDPYFSQMPQNKKEGQSTLIDEMAEVGMYFTAAITGGRGIEVGVPMINEYLDYDDTQPLSNTNKPKLFISDRCENSIQCFTEYTGVTKAEQWKDGVDPIRYILVSGSEFIPETTDNYGDSTGGAY